jgi:hypothetical protein
MVVTASLEVLRTPPKLLNICRGGGIILKYGERDNHNTIYIHKYVAINLDLQIITINNSKHINKAINRTIYGLREHK